MDIIARLESARSKTLPYYNLDEASLARSYQPGKWTVRFLLHHLADARRFSLTAFGASSAIPGK